MKCTICGNENTKDAKFCVNCGSDITDTILEGGEQNQFLDNDNKGFAVTSMVLGIVSLSLTFVCCIGTFVTWALTIIMGIVGLIFGILSRNSSKKGMALAGIITSILAIVFSLILILLFLFAFRNTPNFNYY